MKRQAQGNDNSKTTNEMTTIKLSFFLAMSRGGESKAAYVFPNRIVIRLQNSIQMNVGLDCQH
jgi:hypothetical protein